MNREPFVTGEFYHVFNRGVDKRKIFSDKADAGRFLKSIIEFNTEEPIGSLYEKTFATKLRKREKEKQIVDIVCYCLNPNHYHFILRQLIDGGISEFMKRLGIGYTRYFNIRQKRSGVLFQGKFKSKRIITNEYLLYVSAYVNLNNRVHRLGDPISKSSSSWDEYIKGSREGVCKKDIILDQFKNISEYKEFAEEALKNILERKELAKELEDLLFE